MWEKSPMAKHSFHSFPHKKMEMSGQSSFNVPLIPTELVTKEHLDITLSGPEPAQLAVSRGK